MLCEPESSKMPVFSYSPITKLSNVIGLIDGGYNKLATPEAQRPLTIIFKSLPRLYTSNQQMDWTQTI